MKIFNKLKIFLFGILSFSFLNSCEDDTILSITEENQPVVLNLDIDAIELDVTNPNNPALTFTWDKSTYSEPVVIDYTLEFSLNQDMTNAIQVGFVNTNYLTYSMKELNGKVAEIGVFPFTWTTVYARVISSIGTQHELKMQSNIVSFSVNSYYSYPYKDLFLVGSATAPGWNPDNNNPPVFRSSNNSKIFNYVGYFYKASSSVDDGRFKLLEKIGAWQPQWGTSYPDGQDPIETSGTIAGNPGTQSSDPGRFGITTSGYYSFTINLSDRTYSIEPYTVSTSPASSVKITGSSLSGDVNLTQYTSNSFNELHLWYVESVHLVPGNFNFVLDATNNWGSTTSFSGTATNGGGQIPVIVEDDYEVWFNDLTGQYHLIPINISQT